MRSYGILRYTAVHFPFSLYSEKSHEGVRGKQNIDDCSLHWQGTKRYGYCLMLESHGNLGITELKIYCKHNVLQHKRQVLDAYSRPVREACNSRYSGLKCSKSHMAVDTEYSYYELISSSTKSHKSKHAREHRSYTGDK